MPGGVFRSELGVRCAALEDDAGNVDQRFHVVDHGRLAEKAGLCGKRRLVAWFPAIAFNRVEERGLFTADIGAGAAANFNVEFEAAAKNVVAEKSVFGGRLNGVLHAFGSQRIFATKVDVTLARAGDKAGNRHTLKNRERIAFHEDAVFESARLGFIGVADDVMRAGGILLQQITLQEKRFPFLGSRKCRAAAAQQF